MPVDKKLSFGAGAVDPSIYGRPDLQKFDSACRILLNMIVHVQGGASNRPGLEFIDVVHDSSEITRPIRFRFNTEQTYILEFSDFVMRVYKDGALVLNSAVTVTAISKADPVELTIGAHSLIVGQHVFVNGGDMVELTTKAYRINSVTATTITLKDIFGNTIDSTAFTTYTTGGTVEAAPIFDTFWPHEDLAKLKFAQNADTLTVTHPGHNSIYNITRTDHDVWAITPVSFTSKTSAPTGFSATPSTANTGVIRNYVVTAIDDDTNEESVASSSDNADHNLAANATRTNDCTWTLVANASKYKVYCDDNASGVFGFIGNVSTNVFEDNFITPDYDITPPETRSPLFVSEDFVVTGATQADPCVLTIMAGARTPAIGDQVEPSGIVGMTELNGNTYFVKAATSTTIDLEDKEGTSLDSTGFGAWSAGGTQIAKVSEQGFAPKCVTYHQQRRCYAGPDNAPSTFDASRIKQFDNFNVSAITQADDAIEFDVVAEDVNEIRDMKSQKDLFLFTSSGVFRIITGNNLAFTLGNIASEEQESWGVSDIRAIKIGQSLLYVQDGERVVRDLQESINTTGFSGDELTLLAGHLFKNRKIVSWAYARDPDSIVWCVMDDGTVNALTYLRKQQIWAWTHHTTDGLFKFVETIPETTREYGVYFVVERTINGSTMKYIERLHNRNLLDIKDSFFVDSGLSLDVPIVVSGATVALPVVLTLASTATLTDGDFIDLSEIVGMNVSSTDKTSALNGNRYKIGNKTSSTVELFNRTPDIDAITNATQANPCEITIGPHTHREGQQVRVSGVVGMTELNGSTYQVKAVTATGVTLKSIAGVDLDTTAFTAYVSGGVATIDDDIDGTAFTAYENGGEARLVVTTLSGLDHLEGESVSILADGGTSANPNNPGLDTNTVLNGSVTLSNAASRVHIGLPYTSDLETIGVDLTSIRGLGDSLGRIKSTHNVNIRVQDSAGIQFGPNEDELEPYKPKAVLANEAQTFLNGVITKNFLPEWDADATVFVRQIDPLPMTILNILPEVVVVENS